MVLPQKYASLCSTHHHAGFLCLRIKDAKNGVFSANRLVFREPPACYPTKIIAKLMCFSSFSLLISGIFSESAQTSDGCLGSHSCGSWQLPRASSNLTACLLAFPDSNSFSSYAFLKEVSGFRWTYLSAEGANVFGSLGNFKLFDNLSEGSTVTGTELSADSSLLCSLCHNVYRCLI